MPADWAGIYSSTIFVYYVSLSLRRRLAVTEDDTDTLGTVTCDSELARIKFDDVNTQTFAVSVAIAIVLVSKQTLNKIHCMDVLQLSYGIEMNRCPRLSA
jgi:hypothetical protein